MKYYVHVLFILLLVIFCIVKIPALTLPYFWDELGVYARAALYMHDHGLSLLPGALPTVLSRGHLLLFTFINGLSFDVFGDSILTGHCTALFFSLLFLIAVYAVGKQWLNPLVAFLIALLMAVQPIFFAQSALMVPEIMLGLCMWLAIYFLVKKNYFAFALTACTSILIKETAIILPVIAITGAAIEQFSSGKKSLPHFLKIVLAALAPLLVFAIFLLIQKKQNGWFLFPVHADAIHFDVTTIARQLTSYCHFIFIEQGRCYLFLLFLLLHGRQLYFRQRQKPGIPYSVLQFILFELFVAAGVFLYLQVPLLFFPVSVAIIVAVFILHIFYRPFPAYFFYLFLYSVAGLAFCAMNFYLNRYVIFLLPALFILMMYSLSFRQQVLMIFLIFCVAVPAAVLHMETGVFHYDEDMGYVNTIHLDRQAISWLNPQLNSRKVSILASFPLFVAFTDSRLGYTAKKDSTDFQLIEIINQPKNFSYILVADPGGPAPHIPGGDTMRVSKSFTSSYGRVTVYKKVK